MDDNVVAGIDSLVPKLVDLLELYGYETTAEQIIEAAEEAGLTFISSAEFEDYKHGV